MTSRSHEIQYHLQPPPTWQVEAEQRALDGDPYPDVSMKKTASLPFGGYLVDRLETARDKPKQEKLRTMFSKEFMDRTAHDSLYPMIRLLLPKEDRERGKYKVGTKKLAEAYLLALGMKNSSSEEARLLQYFASAVTAATRSDYGAAKLAEVVEDILKPRISKNLLEEKTIGDVNDFLDAIVRCDGKLHDVKELIRNAIGPFSAREHKWLVKMIEAEDLKTGFSWKSVLNMLHRRAPDKFNQCQNLKAVCAHAAEWNRTQTTDITFSLRAGIPFSPMVAKSFSAGSVNLQTKCANLQKSIGLDKAFVVDEKMDGNRCLIHWVKGDVFLYSRKAKNHARTYLDSLRGDLTLLLKGVVDNCILDGEILAVNALTGDPLPFGGNTHCALNEKKRKHFFKQRKQQRQRKYDDSSDDDAASDYTPESGDEDDDDEAAFQEDLKQRRRKNNDDVPADWNEDDSAESRIQLVLFDYIMSSDEPELEAQPLSYRRQKLTKLLERYRDLGRKKKQSFERIRMCYHVLVEDVVTEKKDKAAIMAIEKTRLRKIINFFIEVVERNGEGIVTKRWDSPYVIGEKSRGTNHWAKLKPEDGDEGKCDVLIVGGFWSAGAQQHRLGRMDSFLLAVKANEDPSELVIVGKCGIGYSGADMKTIADEIGDDNWKDFAESGNAPLKDWKGAVDDRPDRLVKDVTKSCVLEISFGKLFVSTQYSSGYTMRFPKCHAIRPDKPYDSIASVADLHEAQNSKMVALHLVASNTGGASLEKLIKDTNASKTKKRKRKGLAATSSTGPNEVNTRELAEIREKHKPPDGQIRIFDGMTFEVLDDVRWNGDRRRGDLEKVLAANGAHITLRVDEDSVDELIIGSRNRNVARLRKEFLSKTRSVVDVAYIEACLEAADEWEAGAPRLPLAPRFFITPSRHHAEVLAEEYDTVWGLPLAGPTLDATELRKARDARVGAEKFARNAKVRYYSNIEDLLAFEEDQDDLQVDDEKQHINDVKAIVLQEASRPPLGFIFLPIRCFLYDDDLDYLAPRLRLFGGTVVSDITQATHVMVTDTTQELDLDDVPHLVDPAWLMACIDQKTLLDPPPQL